MQNDQILNYRITRLIGSGGMAKVYEAEHVNLGSKVAIKILDSALASKGNLKERFRNEAKIMASLRHENIVQVLDYYEDEESNVYAIVMEYLDGESLADFIRTHGALSEQLVYDIMTKALKAFGFAHSKGLIHRDVKPANIFITKEKNIKILDFGIAKLIGQDADLTGTGMQMGTPMYMSPEQVKDSKHLDKRSDIYSLGVMMYFMLTGGSPYDKNTNSNFDILNKIVNEPLPEVQGSKFNRVIKKATSKVPENRYQSCDEFLKELNINGDMVESLPMVDQQEQNDQKSENSSIAYASFGLRLVAFLLDVLVFVIAIFLSYSILKDRVSVENVLNILGFFYFVLYESSKQQATPGKQIVGIRVVKTDGNKMSFWNSLVRTLSKSLSSLIIFIGWLMPLWTDRKQALHDMIANTAVVKK